ncbi:hypothetical protein RND71_039832 [Anisodus tanguticus]|uniref:Uncharacterized protein n=1 Tax=Anisodus tanguticus TaxID=243964 RepID=A0AAE1QXK4_9SOLA|nr:hypothetical protein RND71_039832 [Anisodus tanguticus]
MFGKTSDKTQNDAVNKGMDVEQYQGDAREITNANCRKKNDNLATDVAEKSAILIDASQENSGQQLMVENSGATADSTQRVTTAGEKAKDGQVRTPVSNATVETSALQQILSHNPFQAIAQSDNLVPAGILATTDEVQEREPGQKLMSNAIDNAGVTPRVDVNELQVDSGQKINATGEIQAADSGQRVVENESATASTSPIAYDIDLGHDMFDGNDEDDTLNIYFDKVAKDGDLSPRQQRSATNKSKKKTHGRQPTKAKRRHMEGNQQKQKEDTWKAT